MSTHTYLLADSTQHEFVPHHLNFDSTGITIGGSTDWSIRSFQYGYGPSQGIHQVTLRLGEVSVNVLPTRGMGILNAFVNRHRIGWDSPVKFPVHPYLVNQHSRNKLAWLDGFNELICRCGLSFNGPPGSDDGSPSPVVNDLTLHGNIANTPAYWVECSISEDQHKTGCDGSTCHISLTGKVLESTLFGPHLELTSTVKLTLGQNGFTVEDEVTNLATTSGELQLLYHINVGEPFLTEGAEFFAPLSQVVPRDPRAAEGTATWKKYQGPTSGYAEQVYYCKILPDAHGVGHTLLANQQQKLGLKLSYTARDLPCFALWKNTQGKSDGYCTGLEPGTNFPNFKSYERKQGRVVKLPAGEKFKSAFTMEVLGNEEQLDQEIRHIQNIQGNTDVAVSAKSLSGWSPAGE